MALRQLLRERWFRWLFATRLVSQTADGIFQSSLASAVFFNPDHQTDPKQAAAGFVVLLLPYSLVGPFAGVFLDRWSRQRVLVRANLARSLFIAATAVVLVTHGPRGFPFYAAALVALSVNRFYLSALASALPHVVRSDQLLLGNSVTTTAGTAATVVGLGVGLVVRGIAGSGDTGNAIVAGTSITVYLAAATVAARIPVRLLGPTESPTGLAKAIRSVVVGMAAGARQVWLHRPAARALAVIAGSRLLFGMSTIGTLLLYRNYFHDQGPLRSGLVGLGQVFGVSAVGYLTAAVVTPVATARIGKPRWILTVLAVAAVTQVGFGLPFAMAPLLAGAFLLGFCAQSAKICVDTIVQEEIADDFRGRVFSFYDTAFNLTFVAAAVVGALVLPKNGKSYAVLSGIGIGYALITWLYGHAERSRPDDVREASAADSTVSATEGPAQPRSSSG